MRNHILKGLGLAAAAMFVATSAQAQGRGNDRDTHRDGRYESRDDHRGAVVRRNDRDGRDDRRNRDDPRDHNDAWRWQRDHKVPPGLAKKPGQMPPGQYKKRYYDARHGATTLGGVLRRRGYAVERVASVGSSRYVYYRGHDGALRRAIVSPGSDRLGFSNVPSSLLQEVLTSLYY